MSTINQARITPGASGSAGSRPRVDRGRRISRALRYWWFVLPALVIYVFVVVISAGRGIVYAFTDWDPLNTVLDFVGFNNLVRFVGDSASVSAVIRTVLFAVAITVVQIVLGMLLAVAVNSRIKGRTVYRVIFFLPVVIIPVVVSYMWQYILSTDGALNAFFKLVGLGAYQQAWLGQTWSAVLAIVVVAVWNRVGFTMAILVAGLQAVPTELMEASSLDGASRFRQFWSITLPLIRPATVVASLLALIDALKLFDVIWILTQGGPGGNTDTLATLMYRQTFVYSDYSYGVTMAFVLALIVSILAFVQYRWVNGGRS